MKFKEMFNELHDSYIKEMKMVQNDDYSTLALAGLGVIVIRQREALWNLFTQSEMLIEQINSKLMERE